jgi:iron complex transport system permease protein
MKLSKSKSTVIYLLSFILLGMCILASLAWGSRYIHFSEVINSLTQSKDMSFNALVVRERIPRTVFSLIAGASLGVSGALMQSITRNPIADPSILGVNTGASLFVVIGITFFNLSTANGYIWFALVGAAITAICVYGIASIGAGGITPIKLALAGSAVSAILSSLVSLIILPRADVMDAYRFWQVGSLSGATWESIKAVLPFLIVGLAFPKSISKLGADSFSIEVSAENIDVLKDADILVAYGNDDLLKALQSEMEVQL